MIQCHAPTNESKDKTKDVFYDQLQSEIISSSKHDILIVMGDLNAKVENENTGLERVMGKHGCGCMNICSLKWNTFPTSPDSQTDLELNKWSRQKPKKPHLGKWKVEKITDRCESKKRCRRKQRSPSCHCPAESQVEEYWQNPNWYKTV